MTTKRKENLVYKAGLALTLEMMLKDTGQIYFDGYENDADRLEFTFDGHRCRLLEINEADYLRGYITMTVLARGEELDGWEVVTISFRYQHFSGKTLRRILEEAYMCSTACHNDEWADDVDGFINDSIARLEMSSWWNDLWWGKD